MEFEIDIRQVAIPGLTLPGTAATGTEDRGTARADPAAGTTMPVDIPVQLATGASWVTQNRHPKSEGSDIRPAYRGLLGCLTRYLPNPVWTATLAGVTATLAGTPSLGLLRVGRLTAQSADRRLACCSAPRWSYLPLGPGTQVILC